jgi:hypothetical protein
MSMNTATSGHPEQLADFLEEIPDHRNDLGDWCPRSGEYSAGGTCPLYCHEADVLVGFDAGDRELPDSTDLPADLYAEDEHGTKWAAHPDTLRELREPE